MKILTIATTIAVLTLAGCATTGTETAANSKEMKLAFDFTDSTRPLGRSRRRFLVEETQIDRVDHPDGVKRVQPSIVTGTPGLMRRTSQSMVASSRRTQP